jgi:hypothetical protein
MILERTVVIFVVIGEMRRDARRDPLDRELVHEAVLLADELRAAVRTHEEVEELGSEREVPSVQGVRVDCAQGEELELRPGGVNMYEEWDGIKQCTCSIPVINRYQG